MLSEMAVPSLVVIVLAAGASTRFGKPKQRLLTEAVLERVRRSSVPDAIVVIGAHQLEVTAPTIHCPDWEQGRGASLRCGLRSLGGDAIAAIVVLADGPDLSPAAIDRVVDVWLESGAEVVAATYDGNRGHPVLLARAVWERVPEEGARSLPALLVPCDDLGPPGDVDFADDLPERFQPPPAE
jgi:CTP:molybdopterin cytidylyltransferase MocA